MPSRLVTSVLLIALGVCGIGWLSCAGDPQPMLIDAARASQRSDADTIKLIPEPPMRFQGNASAVVHFTDPATIWELCGKAVEGKVIAGKILLGCATTNPPQMALLNPCAFKDELWAREACHEKAHRLGWSYKHEAASTCPPKLPNPCDKINCDKQDTRRLT